MTSLELDNVSGNLSLCLCPSPLYPHPPPHEEADIGFHSKDLDICSQGFAAFC